MSLCQLQDLGHQDQERWHLDLAGESDITKHLPLTCKNVITYEALKRTSVKKKNFKKLNPGPS